MFDADKPLMHLTNSLSLIPISDQLGGFFPQYTIILLFLLQKKQLQLLEIKY